MRALPSFFPISSFLCHEYACFHLNLPPSLPSIFSVVVFLLASRGRCLCLSPSTYIFTYLLWRFLFSYCYMFQHRRRHSQQFRRLPSQAPMTMSLSRLRCRATKASCCRCPFRHDRPLPPLSRPVPARQARVTHRYALYTHSSYFGQVTIHINTYQYQGTTILLYQYTHSSWFNNQHVTAYYLVASYKGTMPCHATLSPVAHRGTVIVDRYTRTLVPSG